MKDEIRNIELDPRFRYREWNLQMQISDRTISLVEVPVRTWGRSEFNYRVKRSERWFWWEFRIQMVRISVSLHISVALTFCLSHSLHGYVTVTLSG